VALEEWRDAYVRYLRGGPRAAALRRNLAERAAAGDDALRAAATEVGAPDVNGAGFDHTLEGVVRWLHDSGHRDRMRHSGALIATVDAAVADLRERERGTHDIDDGE
jgi:hypothetical protein